MKLVAIGFAMLDCSLSTELWVKIWLCYIYGHVALARCTAHFLIFKTEPALTSPHKAENVRGNLYVHTHKSDSTSVNRCMSSESLAGVCYTQF